MHGQGGMRGLLYRMRMVASKRTCFIFSVRWSNTWQVMPSHAKSAGY